MIKLAAAIIKHGELGHIALEHHITHDIDSPLGVFELTLYDILLDQTFAPGSMLLNTLILVSPNSTRITYMYAYGEDLTRDIMVAASNAYEPGMQKCKLVRLL